MQNPSFNAFDFLATPWGKLPMGAGAGAFNPTDIHEIDKRIQELKAVEQWLSLNVNLLKTTIQGLEVQRSTLAAIQAFSDSFATATGTGSSPAGAASAKDPVAMAAASAAAMATGGPGMEQAAQWWGAMQQQFEQMLAAAQSSTASMMAPAASTAQNAPASDGASPRPCAPKTP